MASCRNSSGSWALTGGVGTFSAVNADSFDAQGNRIPQDYHGRTRRDRHEELVAYAIQGALTQARRAYELASGMGRIHANILWEMGAAERIITEVLEQAKGIINGITCGAGMPYILVSGIATGVVPYASTSTTTPSSPSLRTKSRTKWPRSPTPP